MLKQPKKKALQQVYVLMLEKLRTINPNIENKINYYQNLDYKKWTDIDFLSTLAQTIFGTSLEWDTVETKWPAITLAFSNFEVGQVAKYGEKEIKKLMNNPKIIRNEQKIRAVIDNAKEMQNIIETHGSFRDYIGSFKQPTHLIKDLKERFWFLGETNVFEFMKEMGFPYIKDDVQVRRLFYRLGLTPSEDASQEEILKIGKAMAKAVNEPPGVIDCVVWTFGREMCKKKRCEECNLTSFCQFYPSMVDSA